MKRRAFSLVELLVVVGVLAVLAAFLFPFFARRSEYATRPSCQNNLKQVALAFKQYINDFDERYPLIFVSGNSSNGVPPYGWADALQPYIRNTQVYQCPNDDYEGSDDPTSTSYTDYWYNANFVVRDKRGKPIGAKEDIFGSSSQTIMAGEGGGTSGTTPGDASYNQCGDGTSLSAATQSCPIAPARSATYPSAQLHLDGANFAYADGHVKWLRGNSPTQSVQVLSNGMTQKSIAQAANSGKATFSLLDR